MRYTQRYDGEWFDIAFEPGHRVKCCDCGLVHNVDFRVEGDEVQIRLEKNNRSTGQVRRWIKYHQPTQLDLFPITD